MKTTISYMLAEAAAAKLCANASIVGAAVLVVDGDGALVVTSAARDPRAAHALATLLDDVDRILTPRTDPIEPAPGERAACVHCRTEIPIGDVAAVRAHLEGCDANPLVQRLKELERRLSPSGIKAERDELFHEIEKRAQKAEAEVANLRARDLILSGSKGGGQ